MNRFENIILERLKRGAIASRPADSEQKSKLKQDFKYGVEAYKFVDIHGRKKYTPYTVQEISEFMPDDTKYYKYENGEYIFVIDEKSVRETRETIWDVYIVDKKKTFPNIKDDVIVDNSLGMYTLMVLSANVPEPVEKPETPIVDINSVWIDKTQDYNYIPALEKNIDLLNNDIWWVKSDAPAGPDKPWYDEANSENNGYFVAPYQETILRWQPGNEADKVSAENSPYAFILNTWPKYGESVEEIQGSAARATFNKVAAKIIGSNLTKTETVAQFRDDTDTIVWKLYYFRLDDEKGILDQSITLTAMISYRKKVNDKAFIYALQMTIRTWLAPVLKNFAEIKNFMKVPITDYGTYGSETQAVVQKFNEKWTNGSDTSNIPSEKFLNILFRIYDQTRKLNLQSDGSISTETESLKNGSQNAKDFQELLYQVGLKITPDYTAFKTFAKYRTEGPAGGWGGVIDDITLGALHQLKDSDGQRLTVKWNNGDKDGVIEELRKTLGTVSESINYFKGIGLDIKFRDLINEQVTAAEEEAYGGTSTNVSTKSKESSNDEPTDKKPSVKDKPKPAIKKPSNNDDKITDTIIRQENGFLISKSYLDQLTSKKYPAWFVGKELDAKKLMYGKSFKFRDGIGAVEDNQWRGYQQVNTDWIDGNGTIDAGIGSRNISPLYWKNAKKGNTPISSAKKLVQIMDVKFIIGPYYGTPEPKIYTYVYCKVVNSDKGFWVPTTWITLN